MNSEQICDQRCCSVGAIGWNAAVFDRRRECPCHRLRQAVRRRINVVDEGSRAMASETMADVELLLEVVSKRDRDERSSGGDEFHRGGQSALDQGDVTRAQLAMELVHVAA